MKIKEITDEHILFDNGTKITDYHGQDCCERVYADFESLKTTSIMDKNFRDIRITGAKDSGVKLNGYFIPCYNDQNGYYSSDLELIIEYPEKKGLKTTKRIDITEFVEDQIC